MKTLKEKIIEILTPPAPPDARFHGGVEDWEYKYNKTGLDYLVDELLSLFFQDRDAKIEEIEEKNRAKMVEWTKIIKNNNDALDQILSILKE